MQKELERPWIRIAEALESGDAVGLQAFLETLSPGETARAMANLPPEQTGRLLTLLRPADAAEVIDEIPESHAAQLIEQLPAIDAAAIVHELPSDEQADVLSRMGGVQVEALLAELDHAEATAVRELAGYDDHQAGGLMVTEVVAYREDTTVRAVLADLEANAERYAGFEVQYLYVTAATDQHLIGVLRMRDLLLADRRATARSLMIPDPLSVRLDTPLEALAELFEEHPFYGIPVVDNGGRLLGVLRHSDVREAIGDRAQQDLLKAQGIVGGDELRTMPTLGRAGRRLSWLSANIVLNIIAASVIAFYQDTLTAVIALAVFLPILSDMSGCSGNQAVAVSLRELTMGLIRPADAARVWLKEVSVGALNGLALGTLLGAAAWLWKGNVYLGLVVGGAMTLNTLIAVSVGGLVPLVLRRFQLDPALASGPILTTVTDLCGFLLLLGLATAFLPHLIA